MTREDALNQYRYYNSEWYKFTFEDLLNDIYDDFEQQVKWLEAQISNMQRTIKELEEPKTCDGCLDQFSKKGRCESDCYDCSRNFFDLYEPKQN